MNYVARTDGKNVLEIREGVLDDLTTAERAAWVTVYETPKKLDFTAPTPRIPLAPQFTVMSDRVLMDWRVENAPVVWIKMQLKKLAAAVRWEKQQSPLLLPDGTLIDAAESSKAKIDQALTVLEKGWATTIDFKAQNGWIIVDLAGLTFVAQRMVAREQALFSAEKVLAAAIDAESVTTTDEINAWSWPT